MSCRLVSSSLVWFCASSECNGNLRASRRYALSRHIRPLHDRSLSFSLFLPPPLSLYRHRPSFPLSHISPSLLPPRLSFIYRAARVSLFLALLFIDLSEEFVTRHRSKCLVLHLSPSRRSYSTAILLDRFVHSLSISSVLSLFPGI